MQLQLLVVPVLALAIGNAIANPLPVEASLLQARGGYTPPSYGDLQGMRTQAVNWASNQVKVAPTPEQISYANVYFPPQYRPKSWPQYWSLDLWTYYYCLKTYPTYTPFWYSYYPSPTFLNLNVDLRLDLDLGVRINFKP